MKKILAALVILTTLAASAQDQNGVFPVYVNDLNYVVTERHHNAGEVITTIVGAIAGEVDNADNGHLAPSVSAMVRTALSGVRRLASVNNPADATFEITGDITSIVTHSSSRTVERKDSKGKVYNSLVNSYEASVGITLTLTELATGQQWTNSFSGNTAWYEDPASEMAAFEIAVDRLRQEVVKGYNTMFPLVAHIVERGEAKKDKQKDVYIDLGDIHGVVKGMHFDVFEINTIAGRETRKKIGRLKVEEVMGDDISRCKVDKGSKEIKTALDGGAILLVTSVE